jgi:hypothetical protein
MHFIPFEVGNVVQAVVWVCFVATIRRRAFVSVRNIEVVVHVAVEAG